MRLPFTSSNCLFKAFSKVVKYMEEICILERLENTKCFKNWDMFQIWTISSLDLTKNGSKIRPVHLFLGAASLLFLMNHPFQSWDSQTNASFSWIFMQISVFPVKNDFAHLIFRQRRRPENFAIFFPGNVTLITTTKIRFQRDPKIKAFFLIPPNFLCPLQSNECTFYFWIHYFASTFKSWDSFSSTTVYFPKFKMA